MVVVVGIGMVLVASACSSDSEDEGTSSEDSTATSEAATDDGPATSTLEAIEAAEWGDDVGVEVDEEAGTWTWTSNGIPNHDRPDRYVVPLEGVAVPEDEGDVQVVDDPTAEQSYELELPLEPELAPVPFAPPAGGVGVIISGATMFNPYEADGSTVALNSQITVDGVGFVDTCNGHPTPGGVYHYHGIPVCVTERVDTPGEHSHIIGVAFDGFPIYGGQGEDGEAPEDLDDCLGHEGPTPEQPEGIYHYHLSEEEPYSLPCLSGVVDDALDLGAQSVGVPAPGESAAGTGNPALWCSIGAPAPSDAATV
jgi:hypothetical protein